ncbi:pyridoxal phosphate-dependent aminotransferase [Fulvivirga lutimaris]|uniref:pyridoxal phosphate-dependent aminotransferase n=1 Tax=Fulvivirga lutimaris TaxID=1819566 RepID=UPI0012BC7710|nr:histidinol-phosphate transaminase [Fulvivirga lutimaris]MTI38465.1 histidinol-phosphate aminotransferase family protein [Fulvivirga lutimaris]
MESTKLNRRDWLKSGLLTIGGLAIAPHLSFGETPRVFPNTDKYGDFLYSPFFKEHVANKPFAEPKALLAKLNANENPHGPSPKALEAFKDAAVKGNRYAWRELFDLMDKIAKKEGVAAENIMMGPGSSDLLEKTGMVLFLDGGNVVSADPSYMSLIRVAEATGASWKGVPLKDDWSHDLEGMEKAIDADTKLVYICNPNNPTGTITDGKKLEEFCSRVSEKVPVFVDEAYLDFMPNDVQKSMVSLINKGKNVIIARTFSKIHGMAGLRVGYVVAQKETLDKLQKITRGGMGITYPSIYAASASMDDTTFLEKSKKLNTASREHVYASLDAMGMDYVKSYTSFVLFPIELEGKAFLKMMTEQGVGVRSFEIHGKNYCRVSMGTLDEMKIFSKALKKVIV